MCKGSWQRGQTRTRWIDALADKLDHGGTRGRCAAEECGVHVGLGVVVEGKGREDVKT